MSLNRYVLQTEITLSSWSPINKWLSLRFHYPPPPSSFSNRQLCCCKKHKNVWIGVIGGLYPNCKNYSTFCPSIDTYVQHPPPRPEHLHHLNRQPESNKCSFTCDVNTFTFISVQGQHHYDPSVIRVVVSSLSCACTIIIDR